MKLIVGLGNPGRKYQRTRHNVGFEVLALLAKQFGSGRPKRKFQGEVVEASIDGVSALLLCPMTYMNRSGASVRSAYDYFRVSLADVLVVCDDFQLNVGRLRFRRMGSAGGQKGLSDIIRSLATDQFARLRVGVGPLPQEWDPADFVLSRFDEHDAPEIEQVVERAAQGIVNWTHDGIDACMNQYNN